MNKLNTYKLGDTLNLRVVRLPVYSSPTPSAEHESTKKVLVVALVEGGDYVVRDVARKRSYRLENTNFGVRMWGVQFATNYDVLKAEVVVK